MWDISIPCGVGNTLAVHAVLAGPVAGVEVHVAPVILFLECRSCLCYNYIIVFAMDLLMIAAVARWGFTICCYWCCTGPSCFCGNSHFWLWRRTSKTQTYVVQICQRMASAHGESLSICLRWTSLDAQSLNSSFVGRTLPSCAQTPPLSASALCQTARLSKNLETALAEGRPREFRMTYAQSWGFFSMTEMIMRLSHSLFNTSLPKCIAPWLRSKMAKQGYQRLSSTVANNMKISSDKLVSRRFSLAVPIWKPRTIVRTPSKRSVCPYVIMHCESVWRILQ